MGLCGMPPEPGVTLAVLSSREFCHPRPPGVQSPSLPPGSGVLGLCENVFARVIT